MTVSKLRYGTTELLLLCLLTRGPSYGYAIIEDLEAFTDLSFSQAVIYPMLHRLLSHNLLSSSRQDRRIYYSLTSKGFQYLQTEIAEWNDLCTSVFKFAHLVSNLPVKEQK